MRVKDLVLHEGMSAHELLEMMNEMGGFMGVHLATAYKMFVEMLRDDGCLRILSLTGNLISTGLRGIIADIARRRLFHLIITTCGALDHDLARSRADYEGGSFDSDDYELAEKGVHRLGNVWIRSPSYGGVIESEIRKLAEELSGSISTYELSWRLGERISSDSSFLTWCWRNRIPVVVPGIVDGAVGYHLWLNGLGKNFHLDLMKDETLLNELMWTHKRKAGLVLGGGISKHHLLWWSQFGGEGLDYAIYISTGDEYDGSLSGARPREAITWHKVSTRAKHVFVKADATIALPIMYLATIQAQAKNP
ncbi:MAG: deoxyhypusine synthase [Nitrososphaerota archaeon]